MDQVVFFNFPAYLFYLFYLLLTGHWGGGFEYWNEAMLAWESIKFWSLLISLILATITMYAIIRLYQVKQEEEYFFSPLIPVEEEKTNERFAHIVGLVSSGNPNDWRQAIIEADIFLDDVLRDRGYPGDSLGERLKSAQGLRTINDAWDAHKVRNAIAHAGRDFILTERDAKRAIEQYYNVLVELNAL